MTYLRVLGAAPADPEPVFGPTEQVLSRYRSYLIAERRLTTATAEGYVHFVRPFIAGRMSDEAGLAGMTAVDVTGFVLAACPGRARGSAKLIVTSHRFQLGEQRHCCSLACCFTEGKGTSFEG